MCFFNITLMSKTDTGTSNLASPLFVTVYIVVFISWISYSFYIPNCFPLLCLRTSLRQEKNISTLLKLEEHSESTDVYQRQYLTLLIIWDKSQPLYMSVYISKGVVVFLHCLCYFGIDEPRSNEIKFMDASCDLDPLQKVKGSSLVYATPFHTFAQLHKQIAPKT